MDVRGVRDGKQRSTAIGRMIARRHAQAAASGSAIRASSLPCGMIGERERGALRAASRLLAIARPSPVPPLPREREPCRTRGADFASLRLVAWPWSRMPIQTFPSATGASGFQRCRHN